MVLARAGYMTLTGSGLVANLVFGDAGIAAWLPIDTMRFLRHGASAAGQELINCLRASPVIPLAWALQSFILCCCGVSWAPADVDSAANIAMPIIYVLIEHTPS